MPEPSSRCLPVQRFAAYFARLLNSKEDAAPIEPAAIYQSLTGKLAGERGDIAWRDIVAGYAIVRGRMQPEEAAQHFFEGVFERPLYLARDNHRHKGHELLLALCLRALEDGWAAAVMERRKVFPLAAPGGGPASFSQVRARLEASGSAISPGNPAASTREKAGPLFLEAEGARAEVPEELSLWLAVVAAPRPLKPLAGEAWADFRNLVIRAVETANKPYGALLGLGLWPPEWMDGISTHQAKSISVFLSAVTSSGGHTPEIWREAWNKHKVPGFKSAGEFWDSSLGKALRDPLCARQTSLDDLEIAAGDDEPAECLDRSSFEKMLTLCRDAGGIDELEQWLFMAISRGENAAELRRDPRMRARLKAASMSMEDYLEALRLRVYACVRKLQDD
jgi:hypothetical protein